MSVYLVVTFDITDREAYAEYRRQVVPLLQQHGAEIIVADYEPKSVEGEQRGAVIVIRFESEEAALGWYNDPAYAPVMEIRLAATANTTGHLVRGFVMPSE